MNFAKQFASSLPKEIFDKLENFEADSLSTKRFLSREDAERSLANAL